MIKKLALVVVVVILGAVAVLWIGAAASLDWDRQHQAAVNALPEWPTERSGVVRIAANNMEFRARVAGFGGTRGNLLLLHGFPETSAMWQPLIERAAADGYQVVAFDQRGYSPGARPDGADQYATHLLGADALAVADAVGFDNFHLVGHDWGSAVGWFLVLTQPERVVTWSSLSIPHIAAFGEALQTDADQQSRSTYMGFFRLPWLAEQVFAFNNLSTMREVMFNEHSREVADEYMAVFSEPGALTGALNWYRAPQGDGGGDIDLQVTRPVLFVWGSQDPAVGRVGVELQRQYMPDAFQEIELEAGHWLMSSHGDVVTDAVLAHVGRVRDRPAP